MFTPPVKVLYLLLSYPLNYTWLKGELQIIRKEIFIPRYLQYGVLGDCEIFLVFSVYVPLYIHRTQKSLTGIFQGFARSLVIFLKLRKS